MYKAYKAEFTLGLIGSIIGIIVFMLSIVFGMAVGALSFGYYIVPGIITMILLLVAFILGFMGTSKLNRNEKSGGVLLIVSGVLSLIGLFVAFYAAWFAIFSMPLFLTAGIMAVVRKPQAPPAA
jgi:uncharacterized membrane protein